MREPVAGGAGDITDVNVGPGLLGGGRRGAVTVTLDTTYTTGLSWGLNGNAGVTPANTLGATNHATLTLIVNNAPALRLIPSGTQPSVILGAGSNNLLRPGLSGAAIGGGINNSVAAYAVAGLLEGFADGTFERRLADRRLELSTDRTPNPQIWGLRPQHQQLLPRRVFEEYQDSDFVGQRHSGDR